MSRLDPLLSHRVVNQCLTVPDRVTAEHSSDQMKERFETPARRGWGQTAPSLYPHAARIEELGPLGGRLQVETEKLTRKQKNKTSDGGNTALQEKPDESDESEEEAVESLISNTDVIRLVGLFLLSAGLIVTFLFIPVPNNWLMNQDLVYMGAGVILLGATTFLGGIIPCICNHFFRSCCKKPGRHEVSKTKRVKKIIKVSPAVKNEEQEELIRAVYGT